MPLLPEGLWKLVVSFLDKRMFAVDIRGHLSVLRQIRAGVSDAVQKNILLFALRRLNWDANHNFRSCFGRLRGQSDKYLDSPPDGVTIAREIYYRVVHSRRRLLSKFQPNRTCSFVLTACGIARAREF